MLFCARAFPQRLLRRTPPSRLVCAEPVVTHIQQFCFRTPRQATILPEHCFLVLTRPHTTTTLPPPRSISPAAATASTTAEAAQESSVPDHLTTLPTRVYLGIGSNTGNSATQLQEAIFMLNQLGRASKVVGTSFLYKSAPQYDVNQQDFLNAVVAFETNMSAAALLKCVKEIETTIGRRVTRRNGPRVVDIDILFFGRDIFHDDVINLTVPHPRIHERDFVLAPFCDLDPQFVHPVTNLTMQQMYDTKRCTAGAHEQAEGTILGRIMRLGAPSSVPPEELATSMPTSSSRSSSSNATSQRPSGRPSEVLFEWGTKTLVMGILNTTPDSFSDGGNLYRSTQLDVDRAVTAALAMAVNGADIIDIGGESTRPNAVRVSAEEEADRVVPVITALLQRLTELQERLLLLQGQGQTQEQENGHGDNQQLWARRLQAHLSRVCLSVDTYKAVVAAEAVSAGANIVNDISAGTLDARMLGQVARLGVPYILMHMRGDPSTMMRSEHTQYENVVVDVHRELAQRVQSAIDAGVCKWNIIVDPGIGFAKDVQCNRQLIRNLSSLASDASMLTFSHASAATTGQAERMILGQPEGGSSGTVAKELPFPMLVGPSRKRFIHALQHQDPIFHTPYGHTLSKALALSPALLSSSSVLSSSLNSLSASAPAAAETSTSTPAFPFFRDIAHAGSLERLCGTLGAIGVINTRLGRHGNATCDILRVHDVYETKCALTVLDPLIRTTEEGGVGSVTTDRQ